MTETSNAPTFTDVGMSRRQREDGSTYFVVTIAVGGSNRCAMTPAQARGLSAALLDMAARADDPPWARHE